MSDQPEEPDKPLDAPAGEPHEQPAEQPGEPQPGELTPADHPQEARRPADPHLAQLGRAAGELTQQPSASAASEGRWFGGEPRAINDSSGRAVTVHSMTEHQIK